MSPSTPSPLPTLSLLPSYFHPIFDAFTLPSLPLHIRLRLLLFQPIALLAYMLNHIPCHFLSPPSERPKTIHIPVRGGRTLRALLYVPTGTFTSTSISTSTTSAQPGNHPIHIDIHGGAFISGHPEADHRFCRHLAQNGFVVLSISYRFAPRWGFPRQVEDVRDVIGWVVGSEEGKKVVGAVGGDVDGGVTVGGFSAGGNLALSATLSEDVSVGEDDVDGKRDVVGGRGRVKGVVTFYAPIDLTIPPALKPQPAGYPKFDPLAFMMPLFDVYAAMGRETGHGQNPVLSPCLARREQLPERVLMVIAGVDILAKEQLDFVVRMEREGIEDVKNMRGRSKRVEFMNMQGCWHGWLELPSMFIDEGTRTKAFDRAVRFLKEVHQDGAEVSNNAVSKHHEL